MNVQRPATRTYTARGEPATEGLGLAIASPSTLQHGPHALSPALEPQGQGQQPTVRDVLLGLILCGAIMQSELAYHQAPLFFGLDHVVDQIWGVGIKEHRVVGVWIRPVGVCDRLRVLFNREVQQVQDVAIVHLIRHFDCFEAVVEVASSHDHCLRTAKRCPHLALVLVELSPWDHFLDVVLQLVIAQVQCRLTCPHLPTPHVVVSKPRLELGEGDEGNAVVRHDDEPGVVLVLGVLEGLLEDVDVHSQKTAPGTATLRDEVWLQE
mmetsp:Transcript_144828/g.252517  ORF Transcript_144828/g.252517 Transcript_144828/m.252517 type:complete len:266 (+) Transcript_144828:520-1317(+)